MDDNQNIIFRKVTEHDIPQLQKLAIETFQSTFHDQNTEADMARFLEVTYAEERLLQEVLDKESLTYFICDQDTPIGFFKLNWNTSQTEPDYPHALEIQRIYILDAYHRQGIGALALAWIESFAIQQQKEALWLGVWEHNTKAIAFYEKLGFVHISSHVFQLGSDAQTDYIYLKKIDKKPEIS